MESFEEALGDLINQFIDQVDVNEIISALELQLMALKEEQTHEGK